jgi:hypothetical protein
MLRPLYVPERGAGAHCIGGWVGPRAGLDRCGKFRSHRDSIPEPSSPQRVAIPTTLIPALEKHIRKSNRLIPSRCKTFSSNTSRPAMGPTQSSQGIPRALCRRYSGLGVKLTIDQSVDPHLRSATFHRSFHYWCQFRSEKHFAAISEQLLNRLYIDLVILAER